MPDKVEKAEVARLCIQYGFALKLQDTKDDEGKPLKGANLLFAISGCESSFGANCGPRFESAYWNDGKYGKEQIQAELNFIHGKDGASSLSPWQIMAVNAYRLGFTPPELRRDPEKACLAVVGFINQSILGRQHARSLEEIGMCYNAGHIFKKDEHGEYIGLPEVTKEYIKKLSNYYYTEVIA